METLLKVNEKKKGLGKVMIAASAAAVAIIAAAIYLWSFQPALEDQRAKLLEGALKPGTAEFEKVSNDIIFSRDSANTSESYTGMGWIMMNIPADIINKSDRKITLLEINLSVVDQQSKVVKEKNVIVIPGLQANVLPPNETVRIVQTLDGFEPKSDRAMIRFRVTAIKTE